MKEYKLGEIATFSQGVQVDVEFQVFDKKEGYVRFVRIVDYTKRGEEIPRYIKNPGEKYLVSESDLIMIRYGSQTAGKVVRGISGAIANNMFKINLDESIVDKGYMYYLLSRDIIQNYLMQSQASSTMPAITFGMMAKLDVIVPPLEEQKRIASILSSLDEKIDLLHRENATLEAMAETLFKEFVLNKDNDGTLEQIIVVQNGYAFKSKDFKERGDHQIVKIKNILNGVVDIDLTDCVDDSVVAGIPMKFKINNGDVLIAMTGAEIGKLGITPKTRKSLWLNQRVGLLKEKYRGSRYLAYLQLKSDFGQDYIENAATGSAQPNISGVGIEKCGFPNLSEDERIQISQGIGKFYDKIIFNLGKINNIKDLKDNLLNKLMSNGINLF